MILGDLTTVGKREPEAAVFAHRDRERLAAPRMGRLRLVV